MLSHSKSSCSVFRYPVGLTPRPQRFIPRGRNGSGGSSGGGNGDGGGNGRGDDGWKPPRIGWIIAVCGSQILARSYPAISAEVSPPKEELDSAEDWLVPLITSVGISGILGFASAAALKTFGRPIAAVGLVLFIVVQALVYTEVIDINWKKVERKLDITGDGKFDEDDIKAGTRITLRVLTQGIPSIAGFAGGFQAGVWYM